MSNVRNVGKHPPSFLDRGEDRRKVVVGEDKVRSVLGDVRPVLPHSDTNVGALERGRVIDAVTGHGDKGLATVKRFDHADLGVRCTASDDEREERQLVDLVIRELVEPAV